MNRVSTYLNFMGDAEEAFEFYRSVFGTDYLTPVMRLGEMPPTPGMPDLSDEDSWSCTWSCPFSGATC